MKLTELQEVIINAPEPKIAVEACAASLKTSTLIEKVRSLLQKGVEPSSIAAITFTRMAAQEMIDRLGADYRTGMFVGTIHSLAAHFLVENGLGYKINEVAEKEDFDKLFELCKNLNIYHSFDWICIDECQDTGEMELKFIFELINPEHYFCCFDLNQSIYEWRGARPDLLMDYLSKEATFYTLNENYRNGKNILDKAKKMLKNNNNTEDTSIPMRNGGIYQEEVYEASKLVSLIKSRDSYKDWAILCRVNTEVEAFKRDLEKFNIPVATFKQGDLTKSQLENLMTEDSVKIITIHSSKGLAWKNVVISDLKYYSKEQVRMNYVAITRAKDLVIVFTNKKTKRKYF